MYIDLAFNELYDRRFMVLCASRTDVYNHVAPSASLFESENYFLKNAVAADLSQDDLVSLVSIVLLTISQPAFPQRWVTIDVTEAQRAVLGLRVTARTEPTRTEPSRHRSAEVPKPPLLDFENARLLHDFLMQAPTPFLMMKGPEHILTFINPPYMQLVGRDLRQNLLGMSVREFLPELEGQRFFDLLDEVYRTGVAFVGSEVLAHLRNQQTGVMEDHYIDFVNHPVYDNSGAVFGIFVQAHDVTERVLARQVSQSREAQLYRQWAELDTLYRTAPVGICLVDLERYRILRVNDKLASLVGQPAEDLIGRRLLDALAGTSGVEDQLNKAAAGDFVPDFEVACAVPSTPEFLRRWHVSFGPLRGVTGEVEAIVCMSLETTDRIQHPQEQRQNVPPELSGVKG